MRRSGGHLAIALALAITLTPAGAAHSTNATLEGAAGTCAKHWPKEADHGGQHQHCQMAVAICLAESGGNCKATNVNSGGSKDRGLWQINNYYHKEVSDSCAYDCACNAKEAHRISNSGKSWTQWSTYTNGAYKAHLDTAKKACENREEEANGEPPSSMAQMILNATSSTYNAKDAVEWSNKHCDGSGSECHCGSGVGSGCEPFSGSSTCQCAEFVAHSLCHGGMFSDCLGGTCSPGTSKYGDCKGYNLRLGSDLHSKLKGKKGWKEVSKSHIVKGSVVFYNTGSAFGHTCLYIGDGKVNCHNNNRCGAGLDMYPFSSILAPP